MLVGAHTLFFLSAVTTKFCNMIKCGLPQIQQKPIHNWFRGKRKGIGRGGQKFKNIDLRNT